MEVNINKKVKNYTISTGVKSKVINIKDLKIKKDDIFSNEVSFCQIIHKTEEGISHCRQSYLYGVRQAEKIGEQYIYFCPYGLVNWAIPIYTENGVDQFLIGGPVLIHEVDDFMLESIYNQNSFLKDCYFDIEKILSNIEVIKPFRIRHLAELLMNLAQGIMAENIISLKEKNKAFNFNVRLSEIINELKSKDEKSMIYPLEKESELLKYVRLGDKKKAKVTLNKMLGYIYFQSGNKFFIVKSKAIQLMVLLGRAAIEVGADLEEIFGLEYIYLEDISKIDNLAELSEFLKVVLDSFIESTFIMKNVKNKDVIYKAINYIRENYNTNITLSSVASEVGLSSSYFSKLFKEEVNLSYSDYLNKVRIEEAKVLMEHNVSYAEIAQKVGFSNQSYFNQVFKKFEDITPGKWQNRILQ
ncbi:MAG: PocR ligand-binding domain-containing protein [bacterium]